MDQDSVTLRPVAEDDLPIFFRHQSDPAAWSMAAFPPREREEFMAHWRDNVLGGPRVRARTVLVDGEVAGHVVAFDRGGEREVGYWIGREHWGRGIATRALELFIAGEPVRPLRAFVAEGNRASMRVLEKCGFEPVRKARRTLRGETVDEVVYRLEG